MDKTAIEKIEAMSKPNTIGIGGRMYTDKRIFAVEEPEVDSVALSTLSGLVDIVKQERQKFPEKLVVHVVSPYKVNVYSSIRNSDRSRETPYVCKWDGVDVDLDRKMDYAQVALYEADGGAWKLEARKNIANYLRESLKDSGAIVVE